MNVQTIDSIPRPCPCRGNGSQKRKASTGIMIMDRVQRDTRSDRSTFVGSGILTRGDAPVNVRHLYGRAAVAAAIKNGLMPEELGEVLGGRRVVEAFPVDGGESVAAYANRAVAEMMVAYLRHGFA